MPNITGSFAWGGSSYNAKGTGAFVVDRPMHFTQYLWGGASGTLDQGVSINANLISDIYNEINAVQVASLKVLNLCRI